MRDRIAALEAEVAYLRAENARLCAPRAKSISPIVVLKLARRSVRPWITLLIGAWIGYALS